MASLRTPETEARYKALIAQGGLTRGCALCVAPSLREFTHWRIILNSFPYDRIADVHHMCVTRRHVSDTELSAEEKSEFEQIKHEVLHAEYEFLIEATYKTKSIPSHAHIHLITVRE